ncbi:MAG: hypothetical protein PHO15_05025 [Eubacteriales bacterium]|nr:hypothetical protein [Eubacteriales bacterium]
MKKIICIIVVLLCTVCFVSCGASDDNAVLVDPNASEANTDDAAHGAAEPDASALEEGDALYYESNGIKIHVYDMAEDVLDSLGEPKGTFEAASCAYQGVDMFYYYDGFQLTVNEVDDADHVTVIMIVDDTVSIPQGVKIGSTEETMLQCMGDDYTASAGLYQFVAGDTTLQIRIKEGCVAEMMYVYTPQT